LHSELISHILNVRNSIATFDDLHSDLTMFKESTMKTIYKISFIIIATFSHSYAEIRNVPADFETIQAGIDAADDGDTVLVQPGEYVENLNYMGKEITVSSLILITDNPAFIDETIIDGNQQDCVVCFDHNEDRNSILRGFTITNGIQDWGGGIDCQPNTSPTLVDLLVIENEAREGGGGIHCSTNSTPLILRVTLANNNNSGAWGGGGLSSVWNAVPVIRDSKIIGNSGQGGGALFCIDGGGFELDHVLIADNEAVHAGAIWLRYPSRIVINNTTIVNNTSERDGGAINIHSNSDWGSNTKFSNSIIYNNTPVNLELLGSQNNGNELSIDYSIVEGGIDAIIIDNEDNVEFGDDNLDEDPLFVDPDNGNYNLSWENYPEDDESKSPCIDRGDPEYPLDWDGTRVDIGAFPFTYLSSIEGTVTNASDDSP